MHRSVTGLRVYIALLICVLVSVLVLTLIDTDGLRSNVWLWIALTGLFFAAEYVHVYFHDEKARFGLSFSEAILLPMIATLSFSEVVWGVSVAITVDRVIRRTNVIKLLFNVGQFGCAAAAAAGFWAVLADDMTAFTFRNAGVAIGAIIVFAALTHILTAGVVSLAEGRSFLKLSRGVAPVTLVNLGGSLVVGLMAAVSITSARWTVVLLPVFLAAMSLGYRAILRQEQERDRVEYLHSAARALSSSPDLEHAVSGFIAAVAEMVSAGSAVVSIREGRQALTLGIRRGSTADTDDPLTGVAITKLLDVFERAREPIVIRSDDELPGRALADDLEVNSLMAVPVVQDDRVIGLLLAADRIGADEFKQDDARLLEALTDELMIAMDSYRLFSEVAEERERFQRIFHGSKEGICLIDANGVVKAWNPALEQITGYAEAEVIGQPCCDKVLVRDSAQRRIEIEDVIKAAPEDEFELVTKQDPPRWISVLSGPTETAGERGWVVLVRDRTGEHAAEEAKSDFLATISHELRTPLTTIKGSLQVLGRDPSRLPPDTAEQMIEVLRRGADRLERLVLNLLFVSQVETGGVTLISDEIGLTEVITGVLERVPEDPTRVRLVMPTEDPIVRGDREKLAQALEHLLDNAQKYGGPTGTIVVQCTREDGYARVSVTDEGPGIPKADQERIFERFVRLGNILTRETQGAGVGLFIARRSIEGMGGSIWVESEGGKGATFHIRIPLAHPVSVIDEATGA